MNQRMPIRYVLINDTGEQLQRIAERVELTQRKKHSQIEKSDAPSDLQGEAPFSLRAK